MIEYIVKVYDNRTEWYNLDGQRHREDGPAVEWADGDKSWYLNGKLHREDGPAIEYKSGTKEWYLNGKLHRADGPAIDSSVGYKSWYLDDNHLTEEEFLQKITQRAELTLDEIAEKFNIPVGLLKIKKD